MSASPLASLLNLRSGSLPEPDLLALFAALAKEAGRDDLHDELLERASGGSLQPAQDTSPTSSDSPSPASPDAERLQSDGCRLIRKGKLPEAIAELKKAIKLDPANADAHGNLGVAYAQKRKLAEAEAAFRLAIRFAPANVTMYVNLATCLHQQRRYIEAETWARQAIQLKEENAEPYRLLGASLEARRQAEAAEEAFREAVRLDPAQPDGQYRLGKLLARRDPAKPDAKETFAAAEAALREAVRLRPAFPAAWSSLATFLSHRERKDEALEAAREAVKHDPKSADLHNGLGVAFAANERFAEAVAAYREALRLNPKLTSAYSNMGNTLRSLGRAEEAEQSIREALRLNPKYAEAHNNLGIVLVQLGREEEGAKHYDEAIRLKPQYPEAHLNRSLTWLCNGDFARGWPEYEWRLKLRPNKQKATPGPRWDGSPLEGKTLLITAEQGLGDSIHFIRYAMAAKAKGATVIFDSPQAMASIISTCPGVDKVVCRGEKVTYQTHIPLLSLPGLFGIPQANGDGTPESSDAPAVVEPMAAVPYLTADPARVEYWRQELKDIPGLKVGIAWQGSRIHKGDRLRSVALTRFAPLAAIPGVSLLSLQKGAGSEQLTEPSAKEMGIHDFGARTAPEMSDVAALMMALDLVVAVDTAVVHLAGALGRPVWVALPFAPDWRWLRDSERTIWYPSMRLFRQSARGEWDGVFGRLAVALAKAARAKAEGERGSDMRLAKAA